MIDPRNSFVFHIGVGVAYPYGNSKMLPFEKRYFSGGANSVRAVSYTHLCGIDYLVSGKNRETEL